MFERFIEASQKLVLKNPISRGSDGNFEKIR